MEEANFTTSSKVRTDARFVNLPWNFHSEDAKPIDIAKTRRPLHQGRRMPHPCCRLGVALHARCAPSTPLFQNPASQLLTYPDVVSTHWKHGHDGRNISVSATSAELSACCATNQHHLPPTLSPCIIPPRLNPTPVTASRALQPSWSWPPSSAPTCSIC
jgi:hypothetical protein